MSAFTNYSLVKVSVSEGSFKALFEGSAGVVFGLKASPIRPAVLLQETDHFVCGLFLLGTAFRAVGFQGVGKGS
jgi:hypothetical protein